MSTEENKAVVRRAYEALNKGKEAVMAAMDELHAPDYVYHSPSPGLWPDMDLAAMKQSMHAYFMATPDLHYTVEDMVAEGDKVVSRFTWRGTHLGEFMGIPPTGKVVTLTGIYITRVAGGKCVEDWCSADMLGMFQQLGVIPQMAQTGA
jgi:steroid delta-isomerase-like uncharacterized protein